MDLHYKIIARIMDGSEIKGYLLEDKTWKFKRFSVTDVSKLIKDGVVDNAYKRGSEIKIRGQAEHLIPTYDSYMVWRPCNLATILGERVIDGQKLFEVMFMNLQHYLYTEEDVVQLSYAYMFSNAIVVNCKIVPRYGEFLKYVEGVVK